jgi:hypothetical protein
VGALALVFLVIAAATGGISGLLIMLGTIAIPTGIYALLFGRRSWALIPSRKVGAMVIAGAVVAVAVGGSTVAPSRSVPSPDAAIAPTSSVHPSAVAAAPQFTAEEPVDPSAVTLPASSSSVAIASTVDTDTTAIALLETLAIKGRAPRGSMSIATGATPAMTSSLAISLLSHSPEAAVC